MNRHLRGFAASGVTLAALTIVGFAGIWQNVRLVQERRVLRTELAILRGEPLPKLAREDAQATARIAHLARDVAEETALLQSAKAKLAAVQKAVPQVEAEELHSFGRVEEMGRESAEFLPLIVDFTKRIKDRSADKMSDEEQALIGAKLLAWTNRLAAIGELEEDPAEIARFHASSLQARLRLDGATTEKVREQVARDFQQIKQQGLARPQRPESEQGDWYRRRKQALDEASARIEALIPLDQRQPHAVGQSLYLGTGMRTNSHVGADGHGSITMGLDLPGIDMKP